MVLAKPCWFAHNRTGRYLDNRKKTAVCHNVNGDPALFHRSKTENDIGDTT